ncbi:hypothetical protein TcasGA2_TC032315 [Tribolium castaneum]|uniref:Uncharacterized protein n=2 Tax=Tribolium castaneum TaxID=7070 RepID=A0A139WLE3_TRICA|nr:hypothetical protein TcasGA2_TC032315 [Tribolium castaneum]
MCVCDVYGIVCPHNSSISGTRYFLDEPAHAKYRKDTFSMIDEKIKPLKYKITCMPTPPNLPKGYLVSAIIFIKANANPWQRKRAKQPPNQFVINNRYTFVKQVKPRKQIIVFGKCTSLKKSADLILSLKDNYEFPEHILDGYVVDSEEFPMWTACVSIAPMVPNTIKKKEAVTTNLEKSCPHSPTESIADMLMNLEIEESVD